MVSASQNEPISVSQRNHVVLCHNTFKTLAFSFLECIFYLPNSFYYFKIHSNCLHSFIAFPSFCRKNCFLPVLSLYPTHGSNNRLHSMETISRRLRYFFWNVSSLRASIAIYSFIFQAFSILSDGLHI